MAEIFTVETRGVGKPDYTRGVSSSIDRFGIYLKYNQSLVIFGRVFSNVLSAFAWITPVLAPGATISLMDIATGFAMPYTVLQGYGLSFVEAETSHSEDLLEVTYYSPGAPVPTQLVQVSGPLAAGSHTYIQRILGFSTITLDPIGVSAQLVDTKVTNQGAGNLSGEVAIIALLEALGTKPLPTTKTVKCKHCGNEETVPLNTSQKICSVCGGLTMYYDLSKFRRSS